MSHEAGTKLPPQLEALEELRGQATSPADAEYLDEVAKEMNAKRKEVLSHLEDPKREPVTLAMGKNGLVLGRADEITPDNHDSDGAYPTGRR